MSQFGLKLERNDPVYKWNTWIGSAVTTTPPTMTSRPAAVADAVRDALFGDRLIEDHREPLSVIELLGGRFAVLPPCLEFWTQLFYVRKTKMCPGTASRLHS